MAATEANVHRLSVEDVYRMVEAGVLRDEDKVELIDGVLVDMTPPSAGHSAAVAWLTRHFVRGVGEREVRVQDLLRIEGGFVMPDLMVLENATGKEHPRTADLVVEISVTTQQHDRWKASRYARADVDEYWIVDLPARMLTAHRGPGPEGYSEIVEYRDGEEVPTSVGAPAVAVTELLGPRNLA